MRQLTNRLLHDQRGATAIEYGLIASLLAMACVGAIDTLGDDMQAMYVTVDSKVTEATN